MWTGAIYKGSFTETPFINKAGKKRQFAGHSVMPSVGVVGEWIGVRDVTSHLIDLILQVRSSDIVYLSKDHFFSTPPLSNVFSSQSALVDELNPNYIRNLLIF